jgi:carboxylesterase
MFGHGGSRALLAATTAADWYHSARDALAQLEQRCDHIVVGGLGVGSLIALQLALDAPPAVDGLLLMAPSAWPDGWAVPWYAGLLRLLRYKPLANLFRLDEREPYGVNDGSLRRIALADMLKDGRPADDVFGRSVAAHLEAAWLAEHQFKRLGQVRQPTLLIHARRDDRANLSFALGLQQRLGGRVDVVVLDDSYHLVSLDSQVGYVVERTLEFVAAVVAKAN